MEIDMEQALTEVSDGLGLDLPETVDTDVQEPEVPATTEDTAEPVAEKESAPAAPKPSETPATDKPAIEPPPAPSTDLRAPASWRPEAKAAFETLPPVVKQEVLKREEDILRGIGEYKAAATFGQSIDRAIAPYVPLLRQHNIDPTVHIGQLMGIHKTLAVGSPEEKLNVFSKLARDFNVNLGQLPNPEDSPYVDPEVAHLRTQISQLQSIQQQLLDQQTERQQQQVQQIRSQLSQEMNAFAADPEHAFFDEVASDMALLIKSGRATSLKQAYDMALRMSPEVSEKESLRIAAKAAPQKQVQPGAVAAKTTAARNATGVNVRAKGSGVAVKSVSPGAGLHNLDKSIEAAFDQIISDRS